MIHVLFKGIKYIMRKILLSPLWVLATSLLYSTHAAANVTITAKSWLIADASGNVLQGENIHERRSIASISKLMTVMVVLDAQQSLSEKIQGYTRKQLIELALIRSDNHASVLLCNNYIGGSYSCLAAMNKKSHSMNLVNTYFVEPTGLSPMNVSTAQELIQIVMAASEYPEITSASNTVSGKIKQKKKWFTFNNTNPLIKTRDFVVSKTGYIRAAGGCIVMMVETKIGRRIVILLGSQNTHTRIPEAEFVAQLQ
jgi:D-alanyl-D-alanine carboxypeptidase